MHIKKRIILITSLLLSLVLIFSFVPKTDQKEKVLLNLVSGFFKYRHYEDIDFNDDFSNEVYEIYLEALDINKRYLHQDDIDQLKKYKFQIDDQIKQGSYGFFDISADIIHKRILETEAYFTDILSKPFDFELDENIKFDPEENEYPKNKEEAYDSWRKMLKYQAMTRIANSLRAQEQDSVKTEKKDFIELEKEARKKLLADYQDWFRRVSKLDRQDRRSVFFNAITAAYDPHSQYLAPRDNEDFKAKMSGQYEGIGATLRQKEGYLLVVDMFPGSPSWRSKQMEVGDLIMQVAQGDEDFVDILDMKQEKAVDLIKGNKGTDVRLMLRKIDNSVKEIRLTRDVVIMEETYARSYVIDDPKSKQKIGYINIPKFYADFTNSNGRQCGDDVKEELIKLKKEGVDGIIVDVRNNGGGALRETVKIGGLFVEQGPMVQVKSREGKPYVWDDPDNKVYWDGPLAIMVNYSSASASEILAAAIQDYKRGVVVGSRTWGKGTVQRVADLDAALNPQYSFLKPLGAISITIQKYYRVNGGATQLKGVIPDVLLPDSYQLLDIGEKEQENAIPWDEIKAANYFPWDKNIPMDEIKARSEKRVKACKDFQLINENAERLKEDFDKKGESLNFEKYYKEYQNRNNEIKKFSKLFVTETGLHVSSLHTDEPLDSLQIEINNRWKKNLQKDLYLNEAVQVVNDLIKLEK